MGTEVGGSGGGEDQIAKYAAQLADLKNNSKPIINVLTMLAEDYIRIAPQIVQTIEKHLTTVRAEMKLPILYLIDSIIKNVKKDYVMLFTQNIVSTFTSVFEKVDEKTRGQMFKLRLTWNDVFPPKKLYAIDFRCHSLDGGWPVTSNNPPTTNIHVNPKFLSTATRAAAQSTTTTSTLLDTVDLGGEEDISAAAAAMREQLLIKQKELLELQQKKLELELLHAKQQLEEEARKKVESHTKTAQQHLMECADLAKAKTASSVALLRPQISSHDPRLNRQMKAQAVVIDEPTVIFRGGEAPFMIDRAGRDLHQIERDRMERVERERADKERIERERLEKERERAERERERSDRLERERAERAERIEREQAERVRLERERELRMEREREARMERERSERERERNEREQREREKNERNERERERSRERRSSPKTPEKKKDSSSSPSKKKDRKNKSPSTSSTRSPKDTERKRSLTDSVVSKESSSSKRRRRSPERKKAVDDDEVEVLTIKPIKPAIPPLMPVEKRKKGGGKGKNREEEMKRRTTAVLSRNYRKRPANNMDDDALEDSDCRMEMKDVDLRGRSSGHSLQQQNILDEYKFTSSHISRYQSPFQSLLFGRVDVDLRQQQLQVKRAKEQVPSRPLPPQSPASTNDPLGRPLLYNRLSDDPEERKRNLDRRSSVNSIDPVEAFRAEFIDRPYGEMNGERAKRALGLAKDKLDRGELTNDQYEKIVKDLIKINEVMKIREVQKQQLQQQQQQQQQQMIPRMPMPHKMHNPWNTGGDRWVGGNGGGFGRGNEFPPYGPGGWGGHGGPPNGPWGPGIGPPGVGPSGPPPPRGPNPFEEALSAAPIIPADDLIPPASELELRTAERDTSAGIPLDKVIRQVRFYGDTAIVLLGPWGAEEPKEISFQKASPPRNIVVDMEPMRCVIGEPRVFYLDKIKHMMKIGAPTRELYVDGLHYEACFGGPPVRIMCDNRMHNFTLEGPPPQVEVGKAIRFDLLAGRISLIMDASHTVPIFLDEKLQLIDLCGFPLLLRFCDGFNCVILNGRPFPTNFGGLPMSVTLPTGRKHFLRFSDLTPAHHAAMTAFVRSRAPQDSKENPPDFGMGSRGGRGFRGGRGGFQPRPALLPNPLGRIHRIEANPLDHLTNLLTPTGDTEEKVAEESSKSYESERREVPSPPPPSINISELISNLINSGLLPANSSPKVEAEESAEEEVKKEEEEEIEEDSITLPPPPPAINIRFDGDLKTKQSGLILQLTAGDQCGSCGLRFPPDQTLRYSQHLDWHFRVNRREKRESKIAQSRKWYYDLSDWIQYEEVADLEDRAASLFEVNEKSIGGELDRSPATVLNPDMFTVLSLGHEGAKCPQCFESFDSFWDKEREEWRLKDALLADDEDDPTKKIIYHPTCHHDMKAAMEAAEAAALLPSPPPPVEEEDEVLILKEGKKEVVLMEIDVEDDEAPKVETKIESNDIKAIEIDGSPPSPPSPPISAPTTPAAPPQVINIEEEFDLPGLTSDDSRPPTSVFDIALTEGDDRSRGALSPPRIHYQSMVFDFPRIKVEPMDEPEESTPVEEEKPTEDAEKLKEISSLNNNEPIELDLSSDEEIVEKEPEQHNQMVAEIDGNFRFQDIDADRGGGPALAPSGLKIRINISELGVETPKEVPKKDEEAPRGESPTEEPSVSQSSQTVRSLKPRLVGRKFIKPPPKISERREASNLCTIV